MRKKILLVIIVIMASLSNVYAVDNEKISTNIDMVYEIFRDVQNVFEEHSVVEAITYYDKYFVQSYQFLCKKNINKSNLLSQMLEDEKSFSTYDDLIQEMPTDISNFLYINPLKDLTFLFLNETNDTLKKNILSPIVDLKKAINIGKEYTGKYKTSDINAYLSGYLLFVYSRYVYGYDVKDYVKDYQKELPKYKKYIDNKNYDLYTKTIKLFI